MILGSLVVLGAGTVAGVVIGGRGRVKREDCEQNRKNCSGEKPAQVSLATLTTKVESLEKGQDAIFKCLEEMPGKIVENLKNTKGLL